MIEVPSGTESPPERTGCDPDWEQMHSWDALLGGHNELRPRSGHEGGTRDQQISTLLRTVETQIIPRLMMLHRQGLPHETHAHLSLVTGTSVTPTQVAEFTALVLQDPDAASSYIEGLLLDRVPLEAVYLELLAPAARRLGEMWVEDSCDFTAVTLGLGRLHRVLRELSAEVRMPRDEGLPANRILLMAVPGEQHTFGLSMVMEFFRQAGWLVWHDPPDSARRLMTLVRDQWFDVVGLSIGSERHVPALAGMVRDLRRHSDNPSLLVVVGGPLAATDPELAVRVGADSLAVDARQGMLEVERLLASR